MKKLTTLPNPVMDMDGKPMDVTLGTLISGMVYRAASPDPVHAVELAKKIRHSKNGLVLEDNDFQLVEQCVNSDQSTANFAKAQAIEALRRADVVDLNADGATKPNRAARRK